MGPLGLKVDGLQVDWPAVLKRKDTVVNQLWRGVEFLMKKNKIAVFKGQGSIESGNTVVVNGTGEKITAKQLLVATGSRPKSLPDLEIDGDRVINSDHAVSLEQMPRSIVIVGAGAVGTEFACVYNGYGAEVTLIEFQPTVLPLEDQEVGQQLAKVLAKRGIKVMTGAQVQPQTLKRSNGKMSVSVKSGDQTQVVEGERLLVAVGREGLTEGFGLEKLDLKIENGYIKTDEHYRTGHPNVYAAGDVIGNYLLAHVAYYEGEHVMEQARADGYRAIQFNAVVATNRHCVSGPQRPGCMFTAFWVSGLGGRRTVLEGWGYTSESKTATSPTPFPERLALNDAAFTDPSTQTIDRLRVRYGATWLVADTSSGRVSPELPRFAISRFHSGNVTVYELR